MTYTENEIRTAMETWVSDYILAAEEGREYEYGELSAKACSDYLMYLLNNKE